MSIIESKPSYTSDQLLSRAYAQIAEIRAGKTKLKIVAPEVIRENKTRIITNFGLLCASLQRPEDEVKKYLEVKLNVPTSLTGLDGMYHKLKIEGMFDEKKIKEFIVSYIKEFVLCSACNQGPVDRVKRDRLTYVVCTNCKSERSIIL